ncbi:hypothetical protein EYR40_008547 [Pleurotus pulmonarius]|nr:hypothetical protein EYR36_009364 [Pleurotus pulmonarius]KAF4592859.1 hypothetical protein EYR38_008565 [Pleurotus pulmonarius]KAF4593753.1 hypothetical protein EYR40_008547 [Pleurotus pulmonarius]
MAYAHCGICISHHALDAFRFLPCGHGYCNTCMGQLTAPGIPRICPICRKKFRSGQELKIHIELSDPSDAASSIAVDQINSLTKDSSSEAVQKTAQELERMVFQQAEDLDEDKAETIVQAINSLKERVVPVFSLCQTYKQRIEALKVDLSRTAQEKHRLIDELKEVDKLRKNLETAQANWRKAYDKLKAEEKIAADAMKLVEEANRKVGDLTTETTGLRTRMEDAEERNKMLERLLERHVHDSQKKADKINGLKQENMVLKAAQEKRHSSPIPEEEDGGWSQYDSHPHMNPCSTPIRRSTLGVVSQTPIMPVDPLDFLEGLPRPGFRSEWNLPNPNPNPRGVKRKSEGLVLDRHGHPLAAVQLGPKKGLRVHMK